MSLKLNPKEIGFFKLLQKKQGRQGRLNIAEFGQVSPFKDRPGAPGVQDERKRFIGSKP